VKQRNVSKTVEEQDFFEYFLFFAMKSKKTAEKQKRYHSEKPGTLIPGKKKQSREKNHVFPVLRKSTCGNFCGYGMIMTDVRGIFRRFLG